MACVIQPFALILQKQIGHFLTYLHCMVADVKKGPVKKNEPHAMDSQRISMMYLF